MDDCDVIVIGSGPLGALCTRRLAEKGLKVVMLEAGQNASLIPGMHLRNQPLYQKEPDRFADEIIKWSYFFNPEGGNDQLPGANISTVFGGQGILWYNNCPRPSEFELWPCFDKTKWDDLFTQAEKYLEVDAHLFDQSKRQQQIKKKIAHFLAKNMSQRHIINLPVAGKNINGHIHYIATHDILGKFLEQPDQVKIRCDAKTIELKTAHDQIKAVKLASSSGMEEIKAKYIIVAAGAFGTPQLLYHSKIRPDALGKYLHFHPLCLTQLILDQELCDLSTNPDLPARLYIPPTPAFPWHAMLIRNIFPTASAEVVAENNLLELEFFAPMEVRKENQMFFGNESPHFNIELTNADKITLDKMQIDLFMIASQLGKFRRGCEPTMRPSGFAHPMGTCRMGEDAATSVTDITGRVHGFQNLFIASVGLIPVSIAVNPTLTAAALAMATVDQILAMG